MSTQNKVPALPHGVSSSKLDDKNKANVNPGRAVPLGALYTEVLRLEYISYIET